MRAVPVHACRICGCSGLTTVIDFGGLSPCGVFPRTAAEYPVPEPLEVVRCNACGLVQLAHDLPPTDTFNAGFGYRSATNGQMREHLKELAARLFDAASLKPGDLVIDIGANDGTFLAYLPGDLKRVGVDPVAHKFVDAYPRDCEVVAGFWDARIAASYTGRAKAISVLACLYDLPDPNTFLALVRKALAPDGVLMIEVADVHGAVEAWDVISHEHLMYFGAGTLHYLLERHGFDAFSMDRTTTNGGSILILARPIKPYLPDPGAMSFGDSIPERVAETVRDCQTFFDHARRVGDRVHGYAASTRGNTLLQVLTHRGAIQRGDLPFIADANPDKVGKLTPGTLIPIISEAESREMRPDYYFVLASHFRDGFIPREREFLRRGGSLVFPFPRFEIVGEEVLA